MKNIKDYIGKSFGRLTILDLAESRKTSQGKNKRFIKCLCICGVECEKSFDAVLNGGTSSCGCLAKDVRNSQIRFKDYVVKENRVEYGVYNGMKKRCYNKNSKDYPNYGGRGIKMHPDFLLPNGEGFKNFLDCVGKRPKGKYSIDRKDVNGDYECGNIRWATDKVQANNKTTNVLVNYEGKIKTLTQWCEELDLEYNRVQDRMTTYGWDFEKAAFTPKSGKGTKSLDSFLSKDDVIEIFKSEKEYSELCLIYDVAISVISRIKNRKRYIEETEGLGSPGRSSNPYNPSRNK